MRDRRPALVGRPLAPPKGSRVPHALSGPLSDVKTASVEPSGSSRMSRTPASSARTTESYSGEIFDDVPAGPPEDAARPVARRPLAVEERRDGLHRKMRRVEPTSAKKRCFCWRIHATASSAVRFVRSTAFGTGFTSPGLNSCHHSLWRLYMFPHMRQVRRPVSRVPVLGIDVRRVVPRVGSAARTTDRRIADGRLDLVEMDVVAVLEWPRRAGAPDGTGPRPGPRARCETPPRCHLPK